MWSVVESRQPASRRRKKSSAARDTHMDVALKQALSAPQWSVSSLVRDLRHASRMLLGMGFVQRDVVSPLQRYLISHMDGVSSVYLVALGIGPFAREESRSGFLQMALLLALQNVCNGILRKAEKSHTSIASESCSQSPVDSTAPVLSRNKSPTLFTRFFDPVTDDRHAECCAKMNIMVEEKNCYGAYFPEGPHALLIVYLPHSPWMLLRNLLASNIVRCGESGDRSCNTVQLRRILVIGNDVRTKLGSFGLFMDTLIPCLHFHEVRVGNGGDSVNNGEDEEDVDHHVLGGLKGVGRHDVMRAFSATAVMQLNLEREKELSDALRRVRIPAVTRGGPDLL